MYYVFNYLFLRTVHCIYNVYIAYIYIYIYIIYIFIYILRYILIYIYIYMCVYIYTYINYIDREKGMGREGERSSTP